MWSVPQGGGTVREAHNLDHLLQVLITGAEDQRRVRLQELTELLVDNGRLFQVSL